MTDRPDTADAPHSAAVIGAPPRDRREARQKLLWVGVWLAFMTAPVKDLFDGEHTAWATVLGALGLAVFVVVYLTLVFRQMAKPLVRRQTFTVIGLLCGLAVVLSLSLGAEWLVLFVYVSVSAGAALPLQVSRWVIPLVTAVMVAIGWYEGHPHEIITALFVPALLAGFALSGVRHLIRTTVELRQARATVAQLAANEERLRLARDLHDLLGHSLSLITLKSELAGRMLPDHPGKAAEQVADIERVSRQALVDVREAVTGYRRATLPGELAGARTALTAAGIEAQVPADAAGAGPGALPEEAEAALAWAVREAVTNVVRHSGARRCAVELTRRQTLDGPVLELTVADDGHGGPAASGTAPPGNGLTGLAERLADVDGTLSAGPGGRGFTLTARVPLAPATPAPSSASSS